MENMASSPVILSTELAKRICSKQVQELEDRLSIVDFEINPESGLKKTMHERAFQKRIIWYLIMS